LPTQASDLAAGDLACSGGHTPGNVKLLLPPRQSRGNSHYNRETKKRTTAEPDDDRQGRKHEGPGLACRMGKSGCCISKNFVHCIFSDTFGSPRQQPTTNQRCRHNRQDWRVGAQAGDCQDHLRLFGLLAAFGHFLEGRNTGIRQQMHLAPQFSNPAATLSSAAALAQYRVLDSAAFLAQGGGAWSSHPIRRGLTGLGPYAQIFARAVKTKKPWETAKTCVLPTALKGDFRDEKSA
jgi:hypothetical protein